MGFCSHCAVQLLLAEHSIGTPKWGAEKIFLIVVGCFFFQSLIVVIPPGKSFRNLEKYRGSAKSRCKPLVEGRTLWQGRLYKTIRSDFNVLIIRNIHEIEGAKNTVTFVVVEGPESHKHFH